MEAVLFVAAGMLGAGITCWVVLKDCGYKVYGELRNVNPTTAELVRALREVAVPATIIGIALVVLAMIIRYAT